MSAQEEDTPFLVTLPDGKNHHKLNDSWTFWYLIPNRQSTQAKNWSDFLTPLHDFKSIEDFWAIYNTIKPPAALPKGCRYYVFRQGIKPLWEDSHNVNGHEVYAEFKLPDDRQKGHKGKDEGPNETKVIKETSQEKWLELVLSALGLQIANHEKINGLEFNCRGNILKVGAWVAPAEEDNLNKCILSVQL